MPLQRRAETLAAALQSHPELQGDGRHILAGDGPHAAGTSARSRRSLEPSRGKGRTDPVALLCPGLAGTEPEWGAGRAAAPAAPARSGRGSWVLPKQLSSVA